MFICVTDLKIKWPYIKFLYTFLLFISALKVLKFRSYE
jgi:hypothetical protein